MAGLDPAIHGRKRVGAKRLLFCDGIVQSRDYLYAESLEVGPPMTAKPAKSSSSEKKKGFPAAVVGRSAVTGRLVLMPASKGATITVKQAITAVKSVRSKKQK